MNRHAVGLVLFAAALIGGFAWLGAYFHELSGAASYDVSLSRGGGSADREVSADVGRQVYNGRAGCIACHILGDFGVGIRGPNLGVAPPQFTRPIGVRAADEQPGKSAVEHLVQALYEPDAYVGPGFEGGVMPPVHGPPAMLSHDDIRSVLLFLFQRSGIPTTPALEEEILAAQGAYMEDADEGPGGEAASAPMPAPLPDGDVAAGRAAMAEQRCADCHGSADHLDAGPLEGLGGAMSEVELIFALARHPRADGTGTLGDEQSVNALNDIARALREPEVAAPTEERDAP